MAKTSTVITIGRQYGSGGKQVGQKLAEALDIPFYDRELMERASKDSGIVEELFESNDEKPTNSFLYSLVNNNYHTGYSTTGEYTGSYNNMTMNQKVFMAQFDAIKAIADEGPCVMIGRCADYALKDRKNLLSVFIHARMLARQKRVAAHNHISEAEAKDLCKKNDRARASYYNYYTNKTWGEAISYNVCLDTSMLGIDGTVELLMKIIEMKENADTSNAGYALEV